jgi:hypothetical protein
MKNFNIKLKVLAVAVSLSALTSCDQDSDELLIEDEVTIIDENELTAKGTCNPNTYAPIDAISGTDYNSSINTMIDDRSCSYDYAQTTLGSSYRWGRYRLKSSDNTGGLQIRMERSSKRVNYAHNKTLELTGTARILNAGLVNDGRSPSSLNNGDGTYIAQVKGKHDKIINGESADPAIILFIAKPKRFNNGTGSVMRDSSGKIKEFDIWAEQVKQRGGSGSGGRQLKYITTVKRNANFGISIKSTFFTENNIKKQKVRYTINGTSKTFFIPTKNTGGQTTAPIETRIRIGAYRCKGGGADILYRDNLRVN